MSPHDVTEDSTRCYPLTGRHLQVAAILGHVPHGGRVRLTVTELGQIGELADLIDSIQSTEGLRRAS